MQRKHVSELGGGVCSTMSTQAQPSRLWREICMIKRGNYIGTTISWVCFSTNVTPTAKWSFYVQSKIFVFYNTKSTHNFYSGTLILVCTLFMLLFWLCCFHFDFDQPLTNNIVHPSTVGSASRYWWLRPLPRYSKFWGQFLISTYRDPTGKSARGRLKYSGVQYYVLYYYSEYSEYVLASLEWVVDCVRTSHQRKKFLTIMAHDT